MLFIMPQVAVVVDIILQLLVVLVVLVAAVLVVITLVHILVLVRKVILQLSPLVVAAVEQEIRNQDGVEMEEVVYVLFDIKYHQQQVLLKQQVEK